MTHVTSWRTRLLLSIVPAAIAFSASLQAQTFKPIAPLVFTKTFGGADPLPQLLTVSSTGAAFIHNASASTSTGGSWLSVAPAGNVFNPYNHQVIVHPAVDLAAGTYTGQVVFVSGAKSLTVPVSLIITPPGTAFFDNLPGALTFTAQQNQGGFAPQSIRIRNGGPGTLTWTLATSTFNNADWITVSSTSGTAPSWVTVSINPANLPGAGATAGNFNGQLRFQSATSTITVPISVAIGPNVLEQINPLNFTKVFAGQDPVPQVIVAATLGTQFVVAVSAVSGTGGNWLTVSPSGNIFTPAPLAVSVHPDPTLVPGTYTGQVLISNGTNALLVPVNLTIAPAGGSVLDDMPGQLSFTVPVGGVNPPAQFVQVRNEGAGPLNWTMTSTTFNNGNWLVATPSGGTTPSFATVSIVVANLPGGGNTAGTFVGQLRFQDSTGASVTVPISVTVAAPSDFVFRQINGLTFTKPFAGPDPLPQTITAASLGTEFVFNASASAATGGDWLSVFPQGNSFTPNTLRVSVSAAPDLPVGTYTGEVYLRGGSNAVVVPVTLIVASPATPFFDNLPGQLSFSLKTGGPNPPPQQIQVRNGGSGSLPWTTTLTTSDGGDWLTVTPQVGTGTGSVIVGVNIQNVPGGGLLAKYLNGQVLFQSGNNTATVPVSLTIGGDTLTQINPLSFVKTFGGANPLPQTITATSIGADSVFNLSEFTGTGGDWLSVSPLGNSFTPRTVTVTVNAPSNLPVGSYTGEVILARFNGGSNTVTVPVTLTVVPAGAAVFDNVQGQMSFSSAVGGADFAPQTVRLRNAGGGTLNWDVVPSTSDGGNWLSVSPLNGTTPANVTVSIIPANLPSQSLVAGRVTGQLLFRSSSGNVTVPIYVEVGPNVFAQNQPLTFSKVFGNPSPLSQTLTVASTGAAFVYSASANSGNGGDWLGVNPLGNHFTPTTHTVSADAGTAFPAGSFTGQLVFNGNSRAMTVPVYLNETGGAFSLNPTSAAIGAAGTNDSVVQVTAPSLNSAWTAVSNSPFITVISGANGLGSGPVHYAVIANPSTTPRSGTITIAGLTFTVNQAGAVAFSIAPTSAVATPLGGPGSITVTANAPWTAVSNVNWIQITAGANGNGNGTVSYTVLPNPGAARNGSLTVAGINFPVSQASGAVQGPTSRAGIFRGSFLWLLDKDGNHQLQTPPDVIAAFGGVPGDLPITGDWDGSGTEKIGVYRPANGLFILDTNGDGHFGAGDSVFTLGIGIAPGDVPVVGDWNGDGRSKVGIFRSGFLWIVDTNGDHAFGAGDQAFVFGGVPGDIPFTGDWDGSGTTKIGVFRAGYLWVLDTNGNHTFDAGDQVFAFGGVAGDVPLVGDWNGDGRTKVGVFRAGFFWVLDVNGDHFFGLGDSAFAFGGLFGDHPVAGKW